jgi:hypothetical protein
MLVVLGAEVLRERGGGHEQGAEGGAEEKFLHVGKMS